MKLISRILCLELVVCLPPAFAQVSQFSDSKAAAAVNGPNAQQRVRLPPFKFAPPLTPQQQASARANTKPPDRLHFGGPPDNSVWYRHMDAGYNAQAKGDRELAKKHFLASLGELEKKPPSQKDLMTVLKINTLERLLRNTYPKDWSTHDNKSEQTLKLHKEQMETLQRIVKLNQKCIPPGDAMITKYAQRYQAAKAEYEKCLQAQAQTPKLQ